MKKIYEP